MYNTLRFVSLLELNIVFFVKFFGIICHNIYSKYNNSLSFFETLWYVAKLKNNIPLNNNYNSNQLKLKLWSRGSWGEENWWVRVIQADLVNVVSVFLEKVPLGKSLHLDWTIPAKSALL